MFRAKTEAHTTHVILEAPSVLDWLIESLHLTQTPKEWIRIGAVYVNKVRMLHNCVLKKGDYVRIHHPPKRYHSFRPTSQVRVLYDASDIVVVEKPPFAPVHATLDNAEENLLEWTSVELASPLWVTHRLDQLTQGLIVFARSRFAATKFHALLADRQVDKRYRFLTGGAFPCGIHRAYMKPAYSGKREVSLGKQPGWAECLMEVLESHPLNHGLFETHARLITGRTHQIRAQCALSLLPIVGDTLYGGKENSYLALQSYALSFPWENSVVEVKLKPNEAPWRSGK